MPAVIEILSMVLCDYCSNEFSMAVIFSLTTCSFCAGKKDGWEVGSWTGVWRWGRGDEEQIWGSLKALQSKTEEVDTH